MHDSSYRAVGIVLESSTEEVTFSPVMELVIIISTITSFFSHLMIGRSVVANAVSVVLATLITWMLIGDMVAGFDTAFLQKVLMTAVMALVISMVVGMVFAYHKKCS